MGAREVMRNLLKTLRTAEIILLMPRIIGLKNIILVKRTVKAFFSSKKPTGKDPLSILKIIGTNCFGKKSQYMLPLPRPFLAESNNQQHHLLQKRKEKTGDGKKKKTGLSSKQWKSAPLGTTGLLLPKASLEEMENSVEIDGSTGSILPSTNLHGQKRKAK